MASPELRAILIAADEPTAAVEFLTTITGGTITGGTVTDRPATGGTVSVGEVDLVVTATGADGARGVVGVGLSGLPEQQPIELHGVRILAAEAASGASSATPASPDQPAVVVDHVAIAVEDLADATAAWRAATGAPAEIIGPHPISGGSFEAARLTLGTRMIELIAPVAGRDSAVAARLTRAGEGPMALALPAVDLDRTRARLDDAGVRTVFAEPHWLVHPANPAAVLIQLTPRVAH